MHAPEMVIDPHKQKIRLRTRMLYDMQKLRIAAGNRDQTEAKREGKDVVEADLSEDDTAFISSMSEGIKKLELDAEKELAKALQGFPIYEKWLKHQRGCATRMSGFLISETNPHIATTVSKLWRYFGLAVFDGKAERYKKGEKAHFKRENKAKVEKVLADSLIKAGTALPPKEDKLGRMRKGREETVWYRIYADRKHRRKHQLVQVCMACEGTGKVLKKEDGKTVEREDRDAWPMEPLTPPDKKKGEPVVCSNCNGTGGPAPWGKSDAHRDWDARRVMIKIFLAKFWEQYRVLEGLPIRPPYAVEYLKRDDHWARYFDSGDKEKSAVFV